MHLYSLSFTWLKQHEFNVYLDDNVDLRPGIHAPNLSILWATKKSPTILS